MAFLWSFVITAELLGVLVHGSLVFRRRELPLNRCLHIRMVVPYSRLNQLHFQLPNLAVRSLQMSFEEFVLVMK